MNKKIWVILIFPIFLSMGALSVLAATTDVSILVGGGYSPATVNITVGDTVLWTNNDAVTHTVDSNDHPSHTIYTPLNLGNVSAGNMLSLIFTAVGTYGYHDHLFSSNLGTVVVSAAVVSAASASKPLPPKAGNVQASDHTHSSVKIIWSTDRSSYSQVEYGTSSDAYTYKTVIDPRSVVEHSMVITQLSASTTYYFRIISGNALDEMERSDEYSFVTTKSPEEVIPVIENIVTTVAPTSPLEATTSPTLSPSPTVIPAPMFVFTRALTVRAEGEDVRELQRFLAEDSTIYPEGLVTGYFGPLTQSAVRRFQTRYNIVSSGDPTTTGFGMIGPKTRAKLNELLDARSALPSVVLPDEPTQSSVDVSTTTQSIEEKIEAILKLIKDLETQLDLLMSEQNI